MFAVSLLPLWAESGPAGAPSAFVPPAGTSSAEVIDRYVKAVEAQQPQSVSMEIDMDAQLPKLKKQGRLHALRFVTRLGKIFYSSPHFEGDGTVKKEVIARFLQAETEARTDSTKSLAVTPDNYRFKYRGITDYAGQPAYVFQVNARQRRVGLYKGELWIDEETYLPLREWGVLVKSPSMFLKSVYFVRDYTIRDGVSVPRRLITDINTRVVGKAQFTIWYNNVKFGDRSDTAAALTGGVESAQSVGGAH